MVNFMKIMGVCHPIPKNIAEKIYSGKRGLVINSFMKKTKKGQKFLLYESHGAKAYMGWGNIELVENNHPSQIWSKYKEELVLDKKNFFEYVSKKSNVTFIKLKDFQLFDKEIIPKNFVSMRGRYLYEEEYNWINKKIILDDENK